MSLRTLKHMISVRRGIVLIRLCSILGVALSGAATAWSQDAFIDAVSSFSPGTSAGFGAAELPGIVLGPPRGAGAIQGSLDIVSLGVGGSIVVRFDQPVICDGPGPDLTVFENAFHSGSPSGPVFTEYGFVAVSQDGVSFIQFPHDPVTRAGLAGQQPVLSHPDNGIDPLDPSGAGGDTFDLATIGLSWAAYVRVVDVAGAIPDTGDLPQFAVPPSAGFDLDAMAALHACDPGAMASPTPTETEIPPAATPTPTSTATATAVTPTDHDTAVVGRPPLRLRIRRDRPEVSKRLRIKVRSLDVSGDLPIRLEATACSTVSVNVDFDRRAAGAQDVTVVRAGKTRAAIVTVAGQSANVTTPDKKLPQACVLSLTASAAIQGNNDPTPENNTTTVELLVLDLNDVE